MFASLTLTKKIVALCILYAGITSIFTLIFGKMGIAALNTLNDSATHPAIPENMANWLFLYIVFFNIILLTIFAICITMVTRPITKQIDEAQRIVQAALNGTVSPKRISIVTRDAIGRLAVTLNSYMEMVEDGSISAARKSVTDKQNISPKNPEEKPPSTTKKEPIQKPNSATTPPPLPIATEMPPLPPPPSVSSDNEDAAHDKIDKLNQMLRQIQNENEFIKQKEPKNDPQPRRLLGELGTAEKELRSIVDMIVGIADQMSLFALNTTIETTSAGEQSIGKGFSIVANEVNDLARQSAMASELVKKHFGGIHHVTDAITETMREISSIASSIEKVSRRIASMAKENTQSSAQDIDNKQALSSISDSKHQNPDQPAPFNTSENPSLAVNQNNCRNNNQLQLQICSQELSKLSMLLKRILERFLS